MAKADSTVKVVIAGDTKGLSKSLKTAEHDVKGFSAKTVAAGAFAGGIAVQAFDKLGGAAVDFLQGALGEADRLGDATQRIEGQLGKLAGPLEDAADTMTNLGLSKQDVLELEAAFADAGTAAGLADPQIAGLAGQAAATAGAISLIKDLKPDDVIGLIGKAAGGSLKAAKELGIHIDKAEIVTRALKDTGKKNADALTDQDKAAAGYEIVLEKLNPQLKDAVTGTGDLEQKTAGVQAKLETLQGEIGKALEGPLSDFLDWVLHGVDGLLMLGGAMDGFRVAVAKAHDPLADLAIDANNALGPLGDLLGILSPGFATFRLTLPKSHGGGEPTGDRGGNVTINVPDTGQSLETGVNKALRDYESRNGRGTRGSF